MAHEFGSMIETGTRWMRRKSGRWCFWGEPSHETEIDLLMSTGVIAQQIFGARSTAGTRRDIDARRSEQGNSRWRDRRAHWQYEEVRANNCRVGFVIDSDGAGVPAEREHGRTHPGKAGGSPMILGSMLFRSAHQLVRYHGKTGVTHWEIEARARAARANDGAADHVTPPLSITAYLMLLTVREGGSSRNCLIRLSIVSIRASSDATTRVITWPYCYYERSCWTSVGNLRR